jgi:Rieske Fe-S protein
MATLASASPTRRSWIKSFVLGSVSVVAGGPPGSSRLLADITPGAAPADILPLQIADYPALLATGGSVQLQFTTSESVYRPILINRAQGPVFHALDSACKHNGCIVPRYNSTTQKIRCSCHGSEYDITGRVTRGPALQNLDSYSTAFDSGSGLLQVYVPGLNLSIRSITVQSQQGSGSRRLALGFSGIPYATYRVRHASTPASATSIVPFAITPEGSAGLTALTITPSTTFTPTLYVDATGTSGFYVIELVLTEY